MNKKFFAALASATMAFTASGSIAVFADDFVEENTPVINNGQVAPKPTKVKWNQENFGDLATKDGGVNPESGLTFNPLQDGSVETKTLEAVTTITLGADFKGEIKGLEYFTGLTSFTAEAGTLTNKTLDFSANTKLQTLEVTKAADLTGITLPGTFKNADGDEEHALTTLTLDGTKLTSLDLSEQDELTTIAVRENKNLKAITLRKSTLKDQVVLESLGLRDNALESINLDRYKIKGNLNLSGNHIGVLDLSKTEVLGDVYLGDGDKDGDKAQTFYVSETLENVDLAKTFENMDVEKVTAKGFDKKTGVLTLAEDVTTYTYDTGTATLKVKLTKANPMNRLYNPNSGEHFYTADLKEKAALVNLGWQDEGYGWVALATKDGDELSAVHRLYNPNTGDHHYTLVEEERDTLVSYGWKYENVGWYTALATETPVYRQYNPNATGAGSHNYTTDKAENDHLVSLGWTPEGIAWFGLK